MDLLLAFAGVSLLVISILGGIGYIVHGGININIIHKHK